MVEPSRHSHAVEELLAVVLQALLGAKSMGRSLAASLVDGRSLEDVTVRCTFGEVPEVWDGVLVRREVELAEVLAHVAVVPTEEVLLQQGLRLVGLALAQSVVSPILPS